MSTTTKKAAPTLTKETVAALDALTTMSAKIRYLNSKSMSKGDISRTLGIRYQWVRNVLITPLKKAD